MNMTTPPNLDGQPLELLIKLMRMTSAEDPIALVAIKKANSHLLKMGTDWEALLRGKVRIIADPFASINIPAGAMNPNRNQDYTPPPPPRRQPTPTYAPNPPPRPRPAPKQNLADPGPGNGTLEKTIINKHDGTCHKCSHKVLAGHGVAQFWKRSDGKTKWVSEHTGPCPTTARTKPAITTDNFQI